MSRDPTAATAGLVATKATLERVASLLARAVGCEVEVRGPLAQRVVSLDLSRRPPERLFYALGRRAGARVSVRYRFLPAAPGRPLSAGAPVFAREPADLELPDPVPVEEALRALGQPIELAPGVAGDVRLVARSQPLHRLLDSLGAQLGARWQAVVVFEETRSVDAAAAVSDRMHAHYHELTRLGAADRREELAADLDSADALPPEERAAAIGRVARDILSLGDYFEQTPEERSSVVAERARAIAADYGAALASRRRSDEWNPAIRALARLAARFPGGEVGAPDS